MKNSTANAEDLKQIDVYNVLISGFQSREEQAQFKTRLGLQRAVSKSDEVLLVKLTEEERVPTKERIQSLGLQKLQVTDSDAKPHQIYGTAVYERLKQSILVTEQKQKCMRVVWYRDYKDVLQFTSGTFWNSLGFLLLEQNATILDLTNNSLDNFEQMLQPNALPASNITTVILDDNRFTDCRPLLACTIPTLQLASFCGNPCVETPQYQAAAREIRLGPGKNLNIVPSVHPFETKNHIDNPRIICNKIIECGDDKIRAGHQAFVTLYQCPVKLQGADITVPQTQIHVKFGNEVVEITSPQSMWALVQKNQITADSRLRFPSAIVSQSVIDNPFNLGTRVVKIGIMTRGTWGSKRITRTSEVLSQVSMVPLGQSEVAFFLLKDFWLFE